MQEIAHESIVRIMHGPLALEALLLADLRAERDRADPRLLARPLVIVVPSRRMRYNVARLIPRIWAACSLLPPVLSSTCRV